MRQITVEVQQHRRGYVQRLIQALPGRIRPLHIAFGLIDISFMGRFDLVLLGLALGFIFRGGMLELLNQTVIFLETTQVIGALPPFG